MHQNDVDDQQRSELIEKYRDINVDHDWWECLYEDYALMLEEKGISATDFAFSGFYSQGDGASFIGKINLATFLKVHELEAKYPATTFFATRGEVSANLYRRSHHYSHENTVNINFNDDIYNDQDEDDIRYTVYEEMSDQYLSDEEDLDDDVLNICRSYMRDLYRQLRDEYEYLTSDEVVWETIVANDLHVLEAA